MIEVTDNGTPGGSSTVNVEEILFNNGLDINGIDIPNSVITVTFLFDGVTKTASIELPEEPTPGTTDVYNFSASVDFNVSAVPLPASLPLFGAGLAAMGFIGWRRKQRKAAA